METIKAIATRKSVRAFKAEQLSGEVLNRILTAGCAAPIGMGKYDTMHLTVVQNKEVLAQLSGAVGQTMKMAGDPLYGAPTVILLSSQEPRWLGIDYTNAGCIAENMMLAAADAGVGSVLVWGCGGAVKAAAELKKAFAIPEGYKALFGVALGYNAQDDQAERELKMTIGTNHI